MFNRKLKRKVEALDTLYELQREYIERCQSQVYALQAQLKRLTDVLGYVEVHTNKTEYVKKGGPEES